MPTRRCICQHENPDSPYPPGSDGCTPRRTVPAVVVDPVALRADDVITAIQVDAASEQVRPLSLAVAFTQDAQLSVEGGRPPFELINSYVPARPFANQMKEH